MFLLDLGWPLLALSAVIVVLGSARLTRLLVHETFPPAAYLRAGWDRLTSGSDWNVLGHCHWCLSFWVTVASIGLYLLTFLAVWWAWVFWITYAALSMAYIAAWIVHHDEDGAS